MFKDSNDTVAREPYLSTLVAANPTNAELIKSCEVLRALLEREHRYMRSAGALEEVVAALVERFGTVS